ncbi:TetR/AcrR family transcriptional regulator [Sphingopyxis sp. Root1497]|uniref:TetR/AcrR family transcriptional regulator n=1 Tax=Sphingopyxis sp. Root1497 TaxID=1736474 RepID=UPI0009E8A39B|nr:TetR/AcrR family transcriptional regulator [Sphingopyxis sp. Root1497]
MKESTSKAPKSRKPRGDGHERIPEILAAAQRVFSREGFAKTTMRRVASEAGVSPAGLYLYFSSKEAILVAIRDQTFADLHKYTRDAVIDVVDAEQRLRKHLTAYLRYATTNPDSYRLTMRSQLIRTPRAGRPASAREAIGREAFNDLLDDIADLIHPDESHDENITHELAETTWAIIHGLSSLAIDVPDFPTSGIDNCLNQALNMIIAGIRSHEPGRSGIRT